uniref:TBC1 domain family member 20 n=1 Tax=Aceria tosichella TaxID=561515 RepID=A0A6G1S845_9ACAR
MDHPSYEQVILDVNRCAGRLEHIRQCYLHRTDDDDEPPPEDLEDQRDLEGFNSSDDDDDDDNPHSIDDHDCDQDRENKTALISGECNVSNEEEEKCERIAKDLQYQRKLKKKLAKLIVNLLTKKPHLHYYQGFHDVCLTYMIIYGEQEAFKKLDEIVDSHFSIFMQPTMAETQEFLNLIPMILGLHDQRVGKFLEEAEVGTIFALSWVITWFSHVIPNERDVETIFAHLERTDDPHMILYLCAEIVLYKKDELLRLEPEMSTVHHFLCQVPRKEKLPIDELLQKAVTSFQRWPPEYVKQQLDQYRKDKLRVHNYNFVKSFAQNFLPLLASIVSSPRSRTAIVVFVIASTLALQFDRWTR